MSRSRCRWPGQGVQPGDREAPETGLFHLEFNLGDTVVHKAQPARGGTREVQEPPRHIWPAIWEVPESRNWADYAERTARYAFSLPADRQAATLDKYREHWIKLEGREPQREYERAQHHEITHSGPELSR